MAIVNFLSELWGFCLIVVCMSFLVKTRHVKNLIAVAENETALLFIGLADVVLGFTSVLLYNVWGPNWQIIITIIGWLIIIKGVSYLFMPEIVVNFVKKWQTQYLNWAPMALVIGVMLGCVLVYLGMMF